MAAKPGALRRAPDRVTDRGRYRAFERIDGTHPLRRFVPGGYVDYPARRLRGSRVLWFNFDLAREMGLVEPGHADRLNPELERRILDTFSIQIVNEYDVLRHTRIPRADRLERVYFATRYLQIQHPDRRGTTSGDGRSVWNGYVDGPDGRWDISSCGTGVTRLCPATAQSRRFYKTGSRRACYGCGTASVEEGLGAAVMSEIFHRNGIATERVLAVLRLANGFGITVRAGRNLLRPSHFFAPLKQNDRAALAGAVDLFLSRQADNGLVPWSDDPAVRYARFAEQIARDFARVAATFEREYVFCWMEWDGDNILADGGIIDYGSVRQFGLFHREYRYDDGPRYSTTITEQRRKARFIVSVAAQIRDFLVTGKKPPLTALRTDPVIGLFDRVFEDTRDRLLLRHAGFDRAAEDALLAHDRGLVRRFDRVHAHFERARSRRGRQKVADGITWNAIFSTRDVLRELPQRLLRTRAPMDGREFLKLALSSYASARDRRATRARLAHAHAFQVLYLRLVERAARRTGRPVQSVLQSCAERSAVINRFARITGDSVAWVVRTLIRRRRSMTPERFMETIRDFVGAQVLDPDLPPHELATGEPVLGRLFRIVADLRHGL